VKGAGGEVGGVDDIAVARGPVDRLLYRRGL
jgi:hypothetical protein